MTGMLPNIWVPHLGDTNRALYRMHAVTSQGEPESEGETGRGRELQPAYSLAGRLTVEAHIPA